MMVRLGSGAAAPDVVSTSFLECFAQQECSDVTVQGIS